MSEVEIAKPYVPFNSKRAIFELLLVLAAFGAVYGFRYMIIGPIEFEAINQLGGKFYLMLFLSGLFVTLVTFLILFFDRQPLACVGLHFKKVKGDIFWAFSALGSIYIVQLFIVMVLNLLWPQWLRQIQKEQINTIKMFPDISIYYMILFTLFIGFYEEFIFRGFLITRLKVIFKNIWFALFISSVIFGLIHFYEGAFAMFQIFTVAIVLGTVFILRKSLIAPILIHWSFNLITFLLRYFM